MEGQRYTNFTIIIKFGVKERKIFKSVLKSHCLNGIVKDFHSQTQSNEKEI